MWNLLRWILTFQPERELIGNVEATLDLLLPAIQGYKLPEGSVEYLKGLKNTRC